MALEAKDVFLNRRDKHHDANFLIHDAKIKELLSPTSPMIKITKDKKCSDKRSPLLSLIIKD